LTKAWVFQGAQCRSIASAAAAPEAGEIVVAVEASQLLRTDLESRGAVPGVAAVGTVIAAGEQALAMLGKRVLVGAIDPCGECDVCRRGRASTCPAANHRGVATRGTLAERITVHARWVIALGDDLPVGAAEAAAIAGDVAAAYTLYARSNVEPSDAVIVCGATAITRFVVEILRAKGITPLVVVDPSAASWCNWLLNKQAVLCRAKAGTSSEELKRIIQAAMIAALPDGAAKRAWRVIATEPIALPHAVAAASSPGASLIALMQAQDAEAQLEQWNKLGNAVHELLSQESSMTAVTVPHPDLLVDVAAMVAKGEIDLVSGVNVVDIDRVHSLEAEDATRSLVVRIPSS
jgi:D-arabinose 1-dehydrogenase-like Zn-dependent alcohol dehydrogenase